MKFAAFALFASLATAIAVPQKPEPAANKNFLQRYWDKVAQTDPLVIYAGKAINGIKGVVQNLQNYGKDKKAKPDQPPVKGIDVKVGESVLSTSGQGSMLKDLLH